jgi:hypothetical protein
MGIQVLGEPIREMHLEVRPGLYALRYVSSANARTAPVATVRPVSTSADCIQIVTVPGSRQGDLAAPGSSVVIVASSAGAVQISLTPFEDSQNLDAKFSLDLLCSAEIPRSVSAPASPITNGKAQREQQRMADPSLDLVAHVSRRGDVGVDEEGWIAGPRAPSAVEAVQIAVRGAEIGVAAQFRNVASRSSWSDWMAPGAVIGVAQKACPLTGLRLKLVGSNAERFELAGEALFLGTPKILAQGSEINLIGPGELDPLIGLKLALVERSPITATRTPAKPSRVRVFR